MSEQKEIVALMNAYTKILQENAELKRTTQEDAQTILTLIGQLRYCIGIAERGRKEKMPEDVTPEAYLLEYVKGLERIISESQKQTPISFYQIVKDGEILKQVHIPPELKLFASPVIQEGMQLVPIEPTEKMMLDASEIDLEEETPEMYQKYLYEIYKAMLNASKEGV